jgi:hypothetical protein
LNRNVSNELVYRRGRFNRYITTVTTLAGRLPTPLLRAFLIRGAVLWLLSRVMGKVVFAMANMTPSGDLLYPAWVVVMTGSLMFADSYRRKEVMLLYNLGVPLWRGALMGVIPAIVLEVLLVMLLR